MKTRTSNMSPGVVDAARGRLYFASSAIEKIFSSLIPTTSQGSRNMTLLVEFMGQNQT